MARGTRKASRMFRHNSDKFQIMARPLSVSSDLLLSTPISTVEPCARMISWAGLACLFAFGPDLGRARGQPRSRRPLVLVTKTSHEWHPVICSIVFRYTAMMKMLAADTLPQSHMRGGETPQRAVYIWDEADQTK